MLFITGRHKNSCETNYTRIAPSNRDSTLFIYFLCLFHQSSYDELKVFPTIATLDEKQAKHLSGLRQDDMSMTRDERTVCHRSALALYCSQPRFFDAMKECEKNSAQIERGARSLRGV